MYIHIFVPPGLGVRQIIEQTQSSFLDQMAKLKKLVGERASVPKEDVYVSQAMRNVRC